MFKNISFFLFLPLLLFLAKPTLAMEPEKLPKSSPLQEAGLAESRLRAELQSLEERHKSQIAALQATLTTKIDELQTQLDIYRQREHSLIYPDVWKAVRHGHLPSLEILKERGMAKNLEREDKKGYRPLQWAALMANPVIVKWLLDNGAKVNEQGVLGKTALYLSTHFDGAAERATTAILLEAGADPNQKNAKFGSRYDSSTPHYPTPLVRLLAKGRFTQARPLLEKCSADQVNDAVHLLLELPEEQKANNPFRVANQEMVEALLKKGLVAASTDPKLLKLGLSGEMVSKESLLFMNAQVMAEADNDLHWAGWLLDQGFFMHIGQYKQLIDPDVRCYDRKKIDYLKVLLPKQISRVPVDAFVQLKSFCRLLMLIALGSRWEDKLQTVVHLDKIFEPLLNNETILKEYPDIKKADIDISDNILLRMKDYSPQAILLLTMLGYCSDEQLKKFPQCLAVSKHPYLAKKGLHERHTDSLKKELKEDWALVQPAYETFLKEFSPEKDAEARRTVELDELDKKRSEIEQATRALELASERAEREAKARVDEQVRQQNCVIS